MAVVTLVRGEVRARFAPVVGWVSETPAVAIPENSVLLCRPGSKPPAAARQFGAILLQDVGGPGVGARADADQGAYGSDRIIRHHDLGHLKAGDIVLADGRSGHIRTLYRRETHHNALFVTGACNSACMMCSQPPVAHDDGSLLKIALRVVDLLAVSPDPPVCLTISGGEPTLLGDGLLRLLEHLRTGLPTTALTILSNGRRLADANLVAAIAAVRNPCLFFSVPIHADVADVHDVVAQAPGAFRETLCGLYHLAAHGLAVELRVVLSRPTIPRLVSLAEYIYRKLPFVQNVAFMGLEQTGYAIKNREQVWIDPVDYQGALATAVEHLYRLGMNVSIYNTPLCLVPPSHWGFCRQSISDHKQVFLDQCADCVVRSHCAGFFVSGVKRRGRGINVMASMPDPTA